MTESHGKRLGYAMPFDRRQWLAAATACIAGIGAMARPFVAAGANRSRPIRVAAVLTEMTYRSHAHVILENFLEPYYFNGKLTDPGMEIAGVYVDQFPAGRDMARDAAAKYGFKIYPTIAESMRLGTNQLAVDGVLSIGEHGNYARDDRGVIAYPRKRFFDEIVTVFRQEGQVVPLFNDKHLSYRWDWSKEMVDVANELSIPFLAGSSVPLAERRPALELPDECVIDEAMAIHSGPPEVYDFHAMEVLQSMVERRRGGETGIRTIQLLEGNAVWESAKAGRWNYDLAVAAMKAETGSEPGELADFIEPADGGKHPSHAILIEYVDGLKATILRIGKRATRWNFACRLQGEKSPLATSFYVGPWENRNLFKALSHAIQTLIREKRAPYPVERTLLVSGMLAAAMDSRSEQHRLVETPHLKLAYQSPDFRAMREMGASWKIVTEDLPQPAGINPGGPRPAPR